MSKPCLESRQARYEANKRNTLEKQWIKPSLLRAAVLHDEAG